MSFKDVTRQYRYSFSGSDAKAWIYYPGAEDIVKSLESLHTISVSIHEAKGQARALGFKGIRGLSRGVRTIGGSMIFLVVEDNPLRAAMDALQELSARQVFDWPGWSIDRHEVGTGTAIDSTNFNNRMATLLPPMNILIQYVSEGAYWSHRTVARSAEKDPVPEGGEVVWKENFSVYDIEGAAALIRNVEFLDEGIVTSINDVATEVTFSFIATDYKPLSAQVFSSGDRAFLRATEDEQKDLALRGKLFSQRAALRVREEKNAIDTVSRNSTI